jgi:hypothetical protein
MNPFHHKVLEQPSFELIAETPKLENKTHFLHIYRRQSVGYWGGAVVDLLGVAWGRENVAT